MLVMLPAGREQIAFDAALAIDLRQSRDQRMLSRSPRMVRTIGQLVQGPDGMRQLDQPVHDLGVDDEAPSGASPSAP